MPRMIGGRGDMQEACAIVRNPAGKDPQQRTIRRMRITLLHVWSVLVVALLLQAPALAQEDTRSQGQGNEVELSVVSFGIGGLAREGDWTGVQVQMQDLGSSSRDIVLRLEIPDEDGDQTQYDRVVTANPGVVQSFWIYCWLPYQSTGSEYVLKAFEAIDDGGSGNLGEIGFRAGRLLGSYPIYNPQIQSARVGLIGVLGSNQLGLDQYGFTVNNNPWMLFSHELQRTSSGLSIDNLPDRWQGLLSLDTLVWSTSTTAAYDPGRLTPEKARAIREWVQRGGHLVIVLQSSGDPWYLGSHPLRSLLPVIKAPRRNEGVSLEPYRALLTESESVELPTNAVVYSFEPTEDGSKSDAMPVLVGPDDETVVIRRVLGSGMVTVVGLPLNHGQLRRVGLPEPEPFWHRVLGLRGNVLRPDQITDQQKADAASRALLLFDDGVSDSISKTGTAVQGVFFGIVVFFLYWMFAGPLGYAMLKRKKMNQHAWMAFVACIFGFAAIAWIGATALRPKRATISHLSLVEQVHGQDTQRVRTWFSAMLPTYGQATVSVQDPGQSTGFAAQESTDLLIPWGSPDITGVLGGSFPDNSGYRVQSRSPAALTVPTRATVKSFYSEWSGDANWTMPYVVGELGSVGEAQLSLDGSVVSGQIAHNLPGVLRDVKVFVIYRETPINRVGQNLDRRMIAQTAVYAPNFGTDGWAPGQSIELSDITSLAAADRQARQSNYFETAVRFGVDRSGILGSRGTLTDRLVAGMFISQLEPPRFGASSSDPVGERLAGRRLLHGWDLGRWFTQPALIVTGVLEIDPDNADPDAMPSPVWIDGRRVPSSGTTVVTWVYPFDPAPPVFLSFDRPDDGNQPATDEQVED